MIKCSKCKKPYPWYEYWYDNEKKYVHYPTCQQCHDKAIKKESDCYCSDELALFKIDKIEKRIKRLEILVKENG